MRSSFQLSESPSSRRKSIDRCQRLPRTSMTCIDADPSCRTTRSMPARLTTVVTPRGRASASANNADAKIRNNQSHKSPPRANRSRTGTERRARKCRRSTRRRQNRHAHSSRNTAGTARSHKNCGAPKSTSPPKPWRRRVVITPCARAWLPASLQAAPRDRRTPSARSSADLPSWRPVAERPGCHGWWRRAADRRRIAAPAG